MTEARWQCFDDADAFADAVAKVVGRIVQQAVVDRGACLLAVPGGSTPRPIFARLAAADLPWTEVTLVPTDERLVEPDSRHSNARLLRDSFDATGATVCTIGSANADAQQAGRSADAVLQRLPWPPDLIWLGMGEDGHTASVFAGPDLEAALSAPEPCRAVGVRPDPVPAEAPFPRVTLTGNAIVSARSLLVTITGEKKKALLEQALASGPSSELPIGRVLAGAQRPIGIYWCRS